MPRCRDERALGVLGGTRLASIVTIMTAERSSYSLATRDSYATTGAARVEEAPAPASERVRRRVALGEPTLRALLDEGHALADLGAIAQSTQRFEETLALATERGDLSAEGHARCGLARLAAQAGAWQRALEGLDRAKVCALRARDEDLLQLALASASL